MTQLVKFQDSSLMKGMQESQLIQILTLTMDKLSIKAEEKLINLTKKEDLSLEYMTKTKAKGISNNQLLKVKTVILLSGQSR